MENDQLPPAQPQPPMQQPVDPSQLQSPQDPNQIDPEQQYPDGVKPGKKYLGMPKLALIGTIIVALLILLISIAAVYSGIIKPNQPSNILPKAVSDTLGAESYAISGTVSAEASDERENSLFDAKFDPEGNLEVNITTGAGKSKLTISVRTVGEELYFKVNGRPALIALIEESGFTNILKKELGLILDQVNNTWVKVDPTLLAVTGIDSGSDIIVSSEEVQQITNALKNDIFVTVDETLPDEQIQGRDSYHYRVTVDNEKLVRFLNTVKTLDVIGFEISDDVIEGVDSSLMNSDGSSVISQADIWIDTVSRLVNRVSVISTIEGSTQIVAFDVTHVGTVDPIVAPEGSKSLAALIGDITDQLGSSLLLPARSEGALFSEREQRRDAERETDLKLIQAQLNIFADNKERYPTTAEFNSDAWLRKNMPELTAAIVRDPLGGRYVYVALTREGTKCGSRKFFCESFRATADLERDGHGNKDENRDTDDYVIGN